MAKLDQYREYIQNLLTKYGSYKPSKEDVEIQLIWEYLEMILFWDYSHLTCVNIHNMV